MKRTNLIIIGALALLAVVAMNESRFIIWGAYGIPEQPNSPNCGEIRYKYNTKIDSDQEFLDLIESWKNVTSSQVGQEAFHAIQWFKSGQYELDDVSVRESGSLLFREKIYGVLKREPACEMNLEISENGLISARGCCGI